MLVFALMRYGVDMNLIKRFFAYLMRITEENHQDLIDRGLVAPREADKKTGGADK